QTLLYRHTGEEDISVGVPIANRTRRELEPLIGFFANTLVMRVKLEASTTFAGLLNQVKEAALGAFAHQDLPFEMLVERLQPVRDLSHSPLFQVLFVLQNAPMTELMLPDLQVTPLLLDTGKTHFDLTLSVAEEESELHLSFEYSSQLFDEPTISRMF